MKIITPVWILICVGLTTRAQTNYSYTAISNLGQPSYQGYGIKAPADESDYSSVAVSFTTGSITNGLSSVSISMADAYFLSDDNTNVNYQPLIVSIYSDATGMGPDSSLAVLAGNNYPINAGVYTYTNTTSLELLPNTTYWIVASSTSTDYIYEWNGPSTTTLDAGSIWTMGRAALLFAGDIWDVLGHLQFSVTATSAIQPPPISIFQPIFLTFPNYGIPFVLQQNTSLVSTNWVVATNAIKLTADNPNQVIFAVPTSGQQMFFRLGLPQ